MRISIENNAGIIGRFLLEMSMYSSESVVTESVSSSYDAKDYIETSVMS